MKSTKEKHIFFSTEIFPVLDFFSTLDLELVHLFFIL